MIDFDLNFVFNIAFAINIGLIVYEISKELTNWIENFIFRKRKK